MFWTALLNVCFPFASSWKSDGWCQTPPRLLNGFRGKGEMGYWNQHSYRDPDFPPSNVAMWRGEGGANTLHYANTGNNIKSYTTELNDIKA